jgi:GNAT superfamily N-acetyltransferase
MEIFVRPMVEADLDAANRVMRLAFGTFLNLPDPMQFMGDSDYVYTRWRADPGAAFCAEVEGVVVGSVFVGNWGSVGFFGPLTVHPDYWDRGVAQLLLGQVMECLVRWGTRHMGLFTFATSLKHVGLYRKFGFWPRFLTVVMEKEVGSGSVEKAGGLAAAGVTAGGVAAGGVAAAGMAAGGMTAGGVAAGGVTGPGAPVWTKFSDLPIGEWEEMLDQCRALTEKILEGLDVGVEIRSVAEQRLGETVLLWAGDELTGLAVCHCGAGTEAGSGVCYIKFGAVHALRGGDPEFRGLLAACEQLAAERGLGRVSGGVNTARQEAWAAMLDSGWRGKMVGVAMQRPDEPGYNRPGVFLIDDWR